MTTTAKTHALRYRIWAYCQPREWDCTTHEIADGIGESERAFRQAIAIARWGGRLRKVQIDDFRMTEGGRSVYGAAMNVAREVAAGRINAEPVVTL